MSLLKKYKYIGEINNDTQFINIRPSSNSELGKALHPYISFDTIHTIIGDICNLQAAYHFLIRVGYPREFISKKRLTKSNIKYSKTLEEVSPPNLNSIMLYLIWCRITQDKDVLKMFLELSSDIVFTSFKYETLVHKNSSETIFIKYHTGLQDHIAIIRLLKETFDKLDFSKDNTDTLIELMKNVKSNTDKKVFSGLAFDLIVPKEFNF